MKSMTGYGEATSQTKQAKIVVQIRSLNHRHLDLQLKVPREYLAFEEEIRKTVREKLARGRIELFINRFPLKGQGRRLELDEEMLGQYLFSMRRLKKRFGLAGEPDWSFVSSLPDIFRMRELEPDAPREKRAVFKLLASALRRLEQSRTREGHRLQADMKSQLSGLKKISVSLEKAADRISVKMKQEIGSVKNGDVPGKLSKEAGDLGNAVFKGDIHEEVVRLKSHVEALSVLLGKHEPLGKKVDFMLQEVQRELNTISAKLPQLRVVHMVLEGKEKVEKLREQMQNIE